MAPGSSDHQSYYRSSGHTAAATRPFGADPDTWIQVTEIDDDDLQFGGKSLSEWYEEERRRQSHGCSSDEEERGRQRVRKHYQHTKKSDKKH
ncbi:hypothetical protein BN1723_003551 [Verticillium longisporum]|uniref:Uncharacterized protein n=2 Tax=Verticillium TaxID=1036719 RepID=A0A2J8E336_VERDA|nr:V-type proton ATPase subunit D [Verticillium dahliae VDG2]KAF3355051.1 D-arabinitol 2-dehydrogenase [ribulose-forming] [Verticillium dahliae VDG1]KAG7107309.1 hypothetical protein HYQ44_013188 [Verticillium longisporum]PNH26722.1 hypothetical protein BJF96_g9995 [Verticillium dahliae]PNH38618.1 hypothetical protein VD0004_g8221 [Verticillium dahliae]